MIENTKSFRPPRREWLWLIATLFLALCAANNIMLPLFEASDEAAHFGYADYLAREQRLPDLRQDLPSHEVFQPVLYYAALAPIIAPFDRSALAQISLLNFDWFDPTINTDYASVKNLHLHGAWDAWPWSQTVRAVHVARAFSSLLGLGTLLLIWRIGQRAGGHIPWIAPVATLITAFNPKFIHMSSTVTNDVAVTLAATAACAWMLRMTITRRRRDWIVLGTLIGLAVLCKVQALGLLLPVAVLALSTAQSTKSSMRRLAGFAVGFIAITGWWLTLNTVQYGDPLAWQQTQHANAALVRKSPLSVAEMLERVPRLLSSYWGVLGIEKTFPVWVDGVMFAALALAVLGVIVCVAQGKFAAFSKVCASSTSLLVLWQMALLVLFLSWMRTHIGTENSRLLLPGTACVAVLVARGWLRLVPARAHARVALFVGVGMFALSVYALLGVLRPAFAKPGTFDETQFAARGLNPINNSGSGLSIGEQFRLISATVNERSVKPGEAAHITLIWGATQAPGNSSYRTLLEMVDQRGELVARKRYLPGDGRYPTYEWQAGQYFVDEYSLPIDGNAPRGMATLLLSVMAPDAGNTLLPIGGGTKFALGQIKIDAPPVPVPVPSLPAKARFGSFIRLEGIDLRREAPPALSLHLAGISQGPRDASFTFFVHIFDASGRLIWQQDQQPRMATQWWDERDAMIETFPIELDARAARIAFGWYDARTGQRLPAYDAQDKRVQDDVITLWQR